MNNKRSGLFVKILIFTFAAALTISIIYFYASFGFGSDKPAMSVFNSGKDGGSLIYDALSSMGYPVSRHFEAITARTDAGAAHIVMEPSVFLPDKDAPLDWVYNGGRLIWLSGNYREMLRDEFRLAGLYGDFYLFEYGSGYILLGVPDGLTNEALLADRDAGYIMVSVLDGLAADRVYFNEYYHGYAGDPGFFRELPVYIRLITIQLIISAAVIVWRLGKRFGKPVPYYAEAEREENEYITALANIFYDTGKGFAVFSIYYGKLTDSLSGMFNIMRNGYNGEATREAFIRCWKDAGYPYADDLESFLRCAENDFDTKKRAGRRRLSAAVLSYERLNGVIKNTEYAERIQA